MVSETGYADETPVYVNMPSKYTANSVTAQSLGIKQQVPK
jgi:hypothetical protein